MTVFGIAARLAVVLTLILSGGCRSHEAPSAGPSRPSAIVLITIDTLRADAVSFMPGGPETTPFLASLANEGVVFTRAYAPSSWTAPSMASLMTGLWPPSHGVLRGTVTPPLGKKLQPRVSRQAVLPASIEVLAERLRATGFKTIGAAANVHLSADLGFAQGFDYYYDEASFLPARQLNLIATGLLEKAFGENWTASWKQTPTFLWLHYFDPHDPYMARRPWIKRFAPDFESKRDRYPAGANRYELVKRFPEASVETLAPVRALYWSEVAYVDDHLRRLNDLMHFDDPNVLVIMTSDHGEEIGEHGALGHAMTLYEEVVHVPLFVRWPAKLKGGQRSEEPVSLIDVYPTVLELLGQAVPESLPGRPLPWQSEAPQVPRPLFLQTDRSRPPLTAVRNEEWKLIRRERQPGKRGTRWSLFQLDRDPGEKENVAKSEGAAVKRLGEVLRTQYDTLTPPADTGAVPVDEATGERLRALGYD